MDAREARVLYLAVADGRGHLMRAHLLRRPARRRGAGRRHRDDLARGAGVPGRARYAGGAASRRLPAAVRRSPSHARGPHRTQAGRVSRIPARARPRRRLSRTPRRGRALRRQRFPSPSGALAGGGATPGARAPRGQRPRRQPLASGNPELRGPAARLVERRVRSPPAGDRRPRVRRDRALAGRRRSPRPARWTESFSSPAAGGGAAAHACRGPERARAVGARSARRDLSQSALSRPAPRRAPGDGAGTAGCPLLRRVGALGGAPRLARVRPRLRRRGRGQRSAGVGRGRRRAGAGPTGGGAAARAARRTTGTGPEPGAGRLIGDGRARGRRRRSHGALPGDRRAHHRGAGGAGALRRARARPAAVDRCFPVTGDTEQGGTTWNPN